MVLLRTRPSRTELLAESRSEPVDGPRPAALSGSDVGDDHQHDFRSWRPSRRLRVLLLANFGFASFYVTWWLAPGHVGTPILFTLLAVAEGFNFIHLVGLWWAIWATKVDPPPRARTPFAIDVLVPTCGEPLHVLARTIKAAVDMDGAHRTYVCDDAGDPEVQALAVRLGAEYFRRDDRRGAKAGNLNNALRQTSGELFAIFDADHVPRKDFLRRVLGYFEDPTVAFVQTPQYYGNSAANEVARNAYQQQAIFYGPICRGKNGLHAAFCCGTNVVFRRTALEEVGGFDEKSVVEDFVTSMRIHRQGWRSVYYPYILADGLGPSNLRSYFRQQFRWARGSVGALLSGEPFKPGFSLGQRFQYLLATTYYLIGLVTLVYLLLPILYLIGGWSPFSLGSGSFLLFYAPYIVLALITIRWGLGNQLRLEHLRYTYGSFPVYGLAAIAALLHLPAKFRVTGRSSSERHRPPVLAGVAAAFYGATAVAIGVGLFLRPLGARTITNMSWGIVNLLLLNGIVGVAYRELLALRRPAHARARETLRLARALLPIAGGAVAAPAVVNGSGPTILRRSDRLVLPEHAVPPELPARPAGRAMRPALQVALLTLLGFSLRFALIGVQSLRLDESLSLTQVQHHSLFGLWKYLLVGNVHVPLYHTILFFWIKVFGTSEWAIRIPSVLFGTASIPLLYLVGKRLVGARAAVFATAVGAASPFWVWHSDEARMYPLLLFLALASMVLLFQAVEKGKVWRWGAYAAVTGLSLYTHYFAILMPPIHLAYLLVNRVGRKKLLAWFAAMAAVALTFLPWVYLLYTDRVTHYGVSSLTNGLRLEQTYSVFSLLYAFLIFFTVYLIGYHAPTVFPVLSGLMVGAWPLAAQFTILSRRLFSWIKSRATIFLLLWLVLTVGVVFVANIWKNGLWYQKYLILASPAVFLLVSRGLSKLLGRRRVGPSLVFITFALVAVTTNFETNNPVREDYRDVAAVVSHGFQPGDAVLVLPAFDVTPFQYYFDPGAAIYAPDEPAGRIIGRVLPQIKEQHAGGSLWVVIDRLLEARSDRKVDPRISRTISQSLRQTASCGFGRLEVSRYMLPAPLLPARLPASERRFGSPALGGPGICLTAGLVSQSSPFTHGVLWFLVAFNLIFVVGSLGAFLWSRRRAARARTRPPVELAKGPAADGGDIRVISASRWPVPDPQQHPEAVPPPPAPDVTTSAAPDGNTDVTEQLVERLADPDPFLRIGAISAMKGRPDMDHVLIGSLRDEFPLVRREAVRVLADIGSSRATEALIDVAGHDPSAEVREEAVAALAELVRRRRSAGHTAP